MPASHFAVFFRYGSGRPPAFPFWQRCSTGSKYYRDIERARHATNNDQKIPVAHLLSSSCFAAGRFWKEAPKAVRP